MMPTSSRSGHHFLAYVTDCCLVRWLHRHAALVECLAELRVEGLVELENLMLECDQTDMAGFVAEHRPWLEQALADEKRRARLRNAEGAAPRPVGLQGSGSSSSGQAASGGAPTDA